MELLLPLGNAKLDVILTNMLAFSGGLSEGFSISSIPRSTYRNIFGMYKYLRHLLMYVVMGVVTPELSMGRQRLDSLVSRTEQQRHLLDFLLFACVSSVRSSRGVNPAKILDRQIGYDMEITLVMILV